MALKLLKGVVTATIASAAIMGSVFSAGAYGLEKHTQSEIKDMYEKLYFDLHSATEYTEDYSKVSPTKAGNISDATLEEGINSINFCRYLAGLPYDVGLRDDYNELAQNASLIIWMNNELNHHPGQPKGMSDEVYALAYAGSEQSNIGIGFMNIQSAVISGYMSDTDLRNLDMMGHRRWILNPKMQYTGLGMVNSSTAMYVRDKNRDTDFTGDYIYWPPAQMPNELMGSSEYGYAFSVTLNEDIYEKPSRDNVKVTLTSEKLGKTWTFDKNSKGSYKTEADMVGYFNVNTENTGIGNCIIFNPGKLPENDVVEVRITGIYKRKSTTPSTINYKVNFFDLLDDSQYSVGFDSTQYELEIGETLHIKGYNNPLRNAPVDIASYDSSNNTNLIPRDLLIWFYADGSLGDYVDYIQAGGTISLTAKKEGEIDLFLGHNYGWFNKIPTAAITITHSHTRGAWITEKAATATEVGSRYRKCTVCGKEIDREVLPATSLQAGAVTVSISDTKVIYSKTRSTPVPSIKVYSGDKRLTEGEDYTLSYTLPQTTGKATITINGKGYFSGSRSVTYDIVKRLPVEMSSLNVAFSNQSYVYSGKENFPRLTIKEENYTLTEGEDYSIVYSDNINAGTGKITITGKDEYSGELKYTFEITAADIGTPWANDDLGKFNYTGSPITLVLDLISPVTGGKLVENVDYTVSYEDNTAVGTATVTVTGVGNYKGRASNTFEIVSAGGNTGSGGNPGSGGNTGSGQGDVTEKKPNAVVSLPKGVSAEDAEIRFVGSDGKVYKSSSVEGGSFYAALPDGDYDVWVVKKNCVPVKTKMTVGNGAATTLEVEILKYGDVNGDGSIDITDVTMIISYVRGIRKPENELKNEAANVKRDKAVDISDVTTIIAHIRGVKLLDIETDIDSLINS